jgi:hypothetical protein
MPSIHGLLPFNHRNASIRGLIYLLVCIALGLNLLEAPLRSGGWRWDTGNAFGFACLACLLYLFLDVGKGSRQKIHQQLSYLTLIVLLAHVLWLWGSDPTLWFYMTWDSPNYMLAGWLALVLMLAAVITALPGQRRFWHLRYSSFQRWHYWLSLCIVAAAYWHSVGSGFYISRLEAALYGVSIALLLIIRPQRWLTAAHTGITAALIPLAMAAFVLLKAVRT